MTRFTVLKVHHKAMVRRAGVDLPIDRDEAKAMAEARARGESFEEIGRRHGVPAQKVQRRMFSMGLTTLSASKVFR